MAEFWEDIDGWFNFYDLYLNMIKRFDDAIFVEIGCWAGKSTSFMGLNIKKLGKNIKFYAIDIFEPYMQDGRIEPGISFDAFLKNIEPVKDYIIPIKGDSVKVSKQFADKSVDFIFIDGNHDYEAVKKDIELWFPKMKVGAVMAGHDYLWDGVKKAVNERFSNMEYDERSDSWIVNI